ncbi:hypothetical protein [Bradyrhizobium cytisi]|uniref:hypothetical protein n=1 Tax=Bradyrhizobium cytisi TaxID=515489 RepID=UPI001652EE90
MFAGDIDPDCAMFDLHFIGDVWQPVFILAKFLGNTLDAGNVTNLADVHGYTAQAAIADASLQSQGSSPSSRSTG